MRLPSNKTAVAAALVLGAAEVRAATAPYCPESGVCFRWGVVGPAARSGDGVVYFQMQAPADYSWIGLGTGSQMRGSDMFVVYAGADANVTLSTRAGTGHNMPQYAPRSDVRLVEGSGVRDGLMTANIRCSGCDNLDLGSAKPWIAAWSRGNRLGSSSPAERISKHDGYDSFSVDLAKAAVSADRNPFTGPDAGGADAVSGGTGQEKSGPSLADVHGILMAVIFLIGYPLGSTLMPLVGSWILHASWQMVIFAAMWLGFGIGYVISRRSGSFFAGPHTRLGVIVCALLELQPALGWLHHAYYAKHQKHGVISHVHIWHGRGLMVVGIINGGLGLKMGGGSTAFVATYSIVAAVVTLMYVGSMLVRAFRKKQRASRRGGDKLRHNSR